MIKQDGSHIKDSDNRRLRVFLCHSNEDKEFVRNLYKKLKISSIDPWFDEEKLLPGQDWKLEVIGALKNSDAVIICLSNKALKSYRGFFYKEINTALDVAKEVLEGTIFIIPLKIEACKKPDCLNAWHHVNYFEKNGHTLLFKALKEVSINLGINIEIEEDDKDKKHNNIDKKRYLDVYQINILNKEKEFISKKIDEDKGLIESIIIGYEIFNYASPLVLSESQFQTISSLFEEIQNFKINDYDNHKNLRNIVNSILSLKTNQFRIRNKAYLLSLLFTPILDSSDSDEDLFLCELITIYMSYVNIPFCHYKTLNNYGRVFLKKSLLLKNDSFLLRNTYFSALETFLYCYEIQPTDNIINKNIELTIKLLQDTGIGIEDFPQPILERYKNIWELKFKDSNIPINSLNYIFHFPKVLTAQRIIEDIFSELISYKIDDCVSYYREVLFPFFENNLYTRPEEVINVLIKMIFLSNPLTNNIDSMSFKGIKIPSGFSECKIRDELELANCYCDLCASIVIAYRLNPMYSTINIATGKRISYTTDIQLVSLLQALMCADVSNSYLNSVILNKPYIILHEEYKALEKRLLGDNLPMNTIKAINHNLPFDTSYDTKVRGQQAILSTFRNIDGSYVFL